MNRIPFSPPDADAIVAFCARHPLSDFERALLRRLIVLSTSAPEGVLMYGDAGGPALVAVVIDVPENGADAASLELLGGPRPPTRELFERHLLPDAVAFARAGARVALQVSVPASVEGADQALGAQGFAHAFDTCQMRWRADAPPPARTPPPGWRWAALDQGSIPAAHAALRETFRGAPSFNLGALDLFRRIALGLAPGWRVLFDGDGGVAGLVQLVMHETPRRFGELRTLGRAPARRGQGVGEHLMVEALRVLWAAGAREVELGAEVDNDRALDLYRRFGFEIVSRLPWWRLTLR